MDSVTYILTQNDSTWHAHATSAPSVLHSADIPPQHRNQFPMLPRMKALTMANIQPNEPVVMMLGRRCEFAIHYTMIAVRNKPMRQYGLQFIPYSRKSTTTKTWWHHDDATGMISSRIRLYFGDQVCGISIEFLHHYVAWHLQWRRKFSIFVIIIVNAGGEKDCVRVQPRCRECDCFLPYKTIWDSH